MTADLTRALTAAHEAVELGEKATPGPWMYDSGEMQILPSPSRRFDATEGRAGWCGEASNDMDGDFIAHAGTHYPTVSRALIAQAERVGVLEGLLAEAHMKLREDQEDLEARIDAALERAYPAQEQKS